jgi:hypothetical protein
MIKKFENFNEIDPYGEEDWNSKPFFKIGDIVQVIGNNKTSYFINYIELRNNEYYYQIHNENDEMMKPESSLTKAI